MSPAPGRRAAGVELRRGGVTAWLAAPDLQAWLGRSEARQRRRHRGAAGRARRDARPRRSAAGSGQRRCRRSGTGSTSCRCARQSEIGADGHPRRGGFLPPVRAAAPHVGRRPAARSSAAARRRRGDADARAIADVASKEARSGPLVFVTVRARDRDDAPASPCARSTTSSTATLPAPGAPRRRAAAGADRRDLRARRSSPDDVLLFRYSALTFNGHRIHYDRRYVTEVEGYPGLVVHGPLIATLLLDLLRRELADARRAPLRVQGDAARSSTCIRSASAAAPTASARFALWARNPEGGLAMQASAEIA